MNPNEPKDEYPILCKHLMLAKSCPYCLDKLKREKKVSEEIQSQIGGNP